MTAVLTTQRRPTARAAAFWAVALVLGSFLAGGSAPSPLYGSYAAAWGFSATTITIVFGVYAVALLATLLTTGSLSDALGRRPVILAAVALQTLAMVAFLLADGLGWLYAARILQGLGTGLGTPAVAAALVDLAPADRPARAPLVNAVTPAVGLGVGALLAGVLVQYAAAPFRLTYVVLLVGYLLLAVAVVVMPEPLRTAPGERPAISLRPRIGVPPEVRGAFLAVVPGLVATWSLGGLTGALGPSIIGNVEASTNHLLGGLFMCALYVPAGLVCLVVRDWPPLRMLVVGCGILIPGLLVTISGVAWTDGTMLFVGTGLCGVGFGMGFLGSLRRLLGLASPEARAELLAAFYVVSYLSFCIPAVIAGFLVSPIGLRHDAIGYAAIAAALAVVALLAQPRRRSAA